MWLDAAAAKALFAIVIATNQGVERLNPQLPLYVTDRGENWLVTGTPYTDERLKTRYTMCHMFVKKRTAEVTGINCHGRTLLNKEEELHWSKTLTPEQYDRAFGPDIEFQPTGILDIWFALYGGIVNTPAAAVDYATVLMRTKSAWANITRSELRAIERDKVWHITGSHSNKTDLLTISRRTGEVLSDNM